MRPAMRLPGNTRPGVWRWPIEPGELVHDRSAVACHAAGETVPLHHARIALADSGAGDIYDLAFLEEVDLQFCAGLEVRALALGEARNSTSFSPGSTPGFA